MLYNVRRGKLNDVKRESGGIALVDVSWATLLLPLVVVPRYRGGQRRPWSPVPVVCKERRFRGAVGPGVKSEAIQLDVEPTTRRTIR